MKLFHFKLFQSGTTQLSEFLELYILRNNIGKMLKHTQENVVNSAFLQLA